MNPEFEVHILNETGIAKARSLALTFDQVLEDVKIVVPHSRELSLVKTHLEIASFFAKKGMSGVLENQKGGDSFSNK